jgi:hypothetical protein
MAQSAFEMVVKEVPVPETPQQLLPLLNHEMELLRQWWAKEGGGGLTRFEEQAVRTYITQKLRGHLG